MSRDAAQSADARVDAGAAVDQFVAVRHGDFLIGLPIGQVRDVFQVQAMTPVPLAPAAVAGLVNLRGRIVLLFSLSRLLGLESGPPAKGPRMAVGVELNGETVGVLVDSVRGVIAAPLAGAEPVPAHVDAAWARHARRVYKLDADLMIEIDLNSLLDIPLNQAA